MGRAQLFGLHHNLGGIKKALRRSGHGFGTMPCDNHHTFRIKRQPGLHGVVQKRSGANVMQHFGYVRIHAAAHPGGQNNQRNWC